MEAENNVLHNSESSWLEFYDVMDNVDTELKFAIRGIENEMNVIADIMELCG